MLWDEQNIVLERVNAATITEANLTQLAIASILSKKAGKEFEKLVKGLNVETVPFEDETEEAIEPWLGKMSI